MLSVCISAIMSVGVTICVFYGHYIANYGFKSSPTQVAFTVVLQTGYILAIFLHSMYSDS